MILTDVRAELRDAARSFARERLAPGAAARDAEHRFPAAELREMGALGFLGMLVPEEYGVDGARPAAGRTRGVDHRALQPTTAQERLAR